MVEREVRQRLAAILAADVVSYSRLMGDDERATIDALNDCREIFRAAIEANAGRVVDMAGDSVLAIFDTAIGAVNAACAAQNGIADFNTDLSEDRRMLYRIGLNTGDVHEQNDGTVYGDGVNIAARLESLAEPGGVAISGLVYETVRGKVQCDFADMGDHEVKNIAEPVHAWRLLGASEDTQYGEAAVETVFDRPAIAVLPFDNMSNDPEQDYFVDGLTEDIITALAAWRSFPVIARNSTFAYKGTSPDIRTVGTELGARYVLEGGVRKGGNRIRITAQLIDASTGHHLWADRYDRQLEDIFELQDEMTRRIAAIVAPEVERAEQMRLVARDPINLAAWELCHRGIALLDQYSKEAISEAQDVFGRAIELEPNYAQAYAWLAESHSLELVLELTDNREASVSRAIEAATKAVEIDETDSFAHAMLAGAHLWPSRYEAALVAAERSVELNPSNSLGLAFLAVALESLCRHDDAIERFEQSIQLNPRDSRRHIYITGMARAHLGARRYDKAVETAKRTINQRPDFPNSHYILASALGHLGRFEEARAELAECERLHPGYIERRLNYAPYRDPAENEHLHAGVRAAQAAETDLN
jgi:adenylate cyclase